MQEYKVKYFLFFLVRINLHIYIVLGKSYCPNGEDYSPCLCSPDWVFCGNIPLSKISQVFQQKEEQNFNAIDIENIEIRIASMDLVIPDNLLAGHQVKNEIELYAIVIGFQTLRIAPEAFRSSQNYTRIVKFFFFNLSGLDFVFLKNFKKIKELIFMWDLNIHLVFWDTLPPLNSLRSLSINYCTGLNIWTEFPQLVNGLAHFTLVGNNIDDFVMNRILQKILQSSENTLEHLNLEKNALIEFPWQIQSFKRLNWLYAGLNPSMLTSVKAGSFSFLSNSSIQGIYLVSSGIEAIEPGAFPGIYQI